MSLFNQIDVQNLFHDSFISCLYMFRAHVLIIRRSKHVEARNKTYCETNFVQQFG